MWRRSEGVSERYLFKLSAAASDDLYRWSAAQWTLQSEKLLRGVVVEVKWRLTSERKLRPVCTSGVHTASLEAQFNQAGPRYIVMHRKPNQTQGDTSVGGMWGAIVGAFSREMWRTPDNQKHSYFLALVPDLGNETSPKLSASGWVIDLGWGCVGFYICSTFWMYNLVFDGLNQTLRAVTPVAKSGA